MFRRLFFTDFFNLDWPLKMVQNLVTMLITIHPPFSSSKRCNTFLFDFKMHCSNALGMIDLGNKISLAFLVFKIFRQISGNMVLHRLKLKIMFHK